MTKTHPSEPEFRPACPACGSSSSVVAIVYGYPGIESVRKQARGELRLGGCVVTGDDPTWYCTTCKSEFK